MNPKWKKPRKPRRRARKSKPAKSLQMKPYSYVFALESQVLKATGAVGIMDFSSAGGSFPLTNATISIQPSSNGLTNYYDIGISTPFQLNDLFNVTGYTSIYDAYKFGKVSCNVEFLSNSTAVNGAGLMPTLYSYWDNDDFVTPSTLQQLTSKQGHKRSQFGNKSRTSITTTGTPKPITRAGSVPSLINATKPQWVNCTDPGLLHYALKMYITDVYLPTTVNVSNAFRFNFKYNVQFRAPVAAS